MHMHAHVHVHVHVRRMYITDHNDIIENEPSEIHAIYISATRHDPE